MAVNEQPHIHELIICANVFVRKDGKILMIKRSPHKQYAPNFLAPIGGKVLRGENPYNAAVREAREEAGFELKNLRLEAVITEIQPYKNEPYDWLIFHFTADFAGGQLHQTDEGELVFLSEQEIFAAAKLFPSHRELIRNILNPKDALVCATFEYNDQHEIIQETKIIEHCAL